MSIANQVDATAQAAIDLALRKRAARQAAGQLNAPRVIEKVRVRVLKLGADKVSMGIHIAGIGEAFYERGEEFEVERQIADSLEDIGYVEIVGDATGALSTIEATMQAAAAQALVTEEAAAAQRTAGINAALAAAEAAQAAAAPVEELPPLPPVEAPPVEDPAADAAAKAVAKAKA
jgi:hypothetical protein